MKLPIEPRLMVWSCQLIVADAQHFSKFPNWKLYLLQEIPVV